MYSFSLLNYISLHWVSKNICLNSLSIFSYEITLAHNYNKICTRQWSTRSTDSLRCVRAVLQCATMTPCPNASLIITWKHAWWLMRFIQAHQTWVGFLPFYCLMTAAFILWLQIHFQWQWVYCISICNERALSTVCLLKIECWSDGISFYAGMYAICNWPFSIFFLSPKGWAMDTLLVSK